MVVSVLPFDKMEQEGELINTKNDQHEKYTDQLSAYLNARRYNHTLDEYEHIINIPTTGMSPKEIQDEMESLNSIILPENERAEVCVFPIYLDNYISIRYDEIPE